MNNFGNLSRRELLRISALSIGGTAFLAACGAQGGVQSSSNIASAGSVPELVAANSGDITDIVLLRTAASLEYNAIDTYNLAIEEGLLTGDYAKLGDAVKRFRDDHISHAAAINSLVVSLGGKSHDCANERIDRLYLQPALKLITTEDNEDSSRDVVALAHALENLAAQTYQGIVRLLTSPKLRGDAMRIAHDEARHAVVLAQVLNPGYAAVGPTTNEATGKANVASVPSAFGGLSSVQVSLGTANAEGVKPSLTLETPSLNALIYDNVSC
jgi:hypothetical protein